MSEIKRTVIEVFCLTRKVDDMPTIILNNKRDLDEVARILNKPIIKPVVKEQAGMLYVYDSGIAYACGDENEKSLGKI